MEYGVNWSKLNSVIRYTGKLNSESAYDALDICLRL